MTDVNVTSNNQSGGITAANVGQDQPVEPILQFFMYSHLPTFLQEVSKPFGDMASWIVTNLPRNQERTVALRKLLEAKDAAVRARLFK